MCKSFYEVVIYPRRQSSELPLREPQISDTILARIAIFSSLLLTVPPSKRGLTQLSIRLLEKLRDAQVFKRLLLLLAFHGDGRFITVHTSAHHYSLSSRTNSTYMVNIILPSTSRFSNLSLSVNPLYERSVRIFSSIHKSTWRRVLRIRRREDVGQ